MEIIRTTGKEMSSLDMYNATKSPESMRLVDLVDESTLHVLGSVLYKEIKDDTEVTLLSIITDDGVYITVSQTVQRSFTDILSFVGDKNFTVKKISGVSDKNKREYIDIVLVGIDD